MIIKCNGVPIDEARDYTPHQLPPIDSIIKVHPFEDIGEVGDIKEYKVLYYEFNIHKSYNNTYKRDDAIIHVEEFYA